MTLIDANPDGLHALPGVVTHVVTVPELGLVYTSGQVAWDKDGNLVGEGDYESHAVTLDRNEPGVLLVAAGLGPPTEHALISLLALNGRSMRGPAARRARGCVCRSPAARHSPHC